MLSKPTFNGPFHKKLMFNKVIFALCVGPTLAAHAASITTATSAPTETCDLDYQIEAKWNETPRRFDVTLSFDTDVKGEATLMGPKTWAGVDDFDKTILDVRVVGAGISLKAVDSNQWLISHGSDHSKRITVKYSIVNGVANIDEDTPIRQPNFHRNTLAKDHFQLIGNGAFVGPRHLAGNAGGTRATCITFSGLPTSWSFASSFGAGQQLGVAKIRAPGGLNLIFNAVYLGGDFRILRREIEGKPLFMALRGKWSFADEKFANATAALVRAHRAFWNDFDFPHYLIALAPNRFVVGTTYGGTGLHNAFTMHASANFTVPGSQFDSLIGHEHLHTWMPRRIGSMGGNDQQLRYWFSEGFTNYLTHRLLLKSGLWSLPQYADSLNGVIAAYLTSIDVNASNERVLKEFWSSRDSIGYLPYLRGELLAMRWATELARNGKSLEQHLQKLVANTQAIPAGGNGNLAHFATNRLRSALRADLGDAVDADIDAFIERGETLPMDEQFLGPCFDGTFQQRALFELGFEAKSPLIGQAISGVVAGSQAQRAGVRDGMMVKNWSSHNNDSTREITMTVVENNASREVKFFPASAKSVRIPVFTVKTDTATSVACSAWMPKS